MAQKRTAPRKRKESDKIQKDFADALNKNFNLANLELRRPFHFNDNHAKCYCLTQLNKTNMVFVSGPAGSMKTYIAVYSAMEMLRNRNVDRVVYIRSVVESSSKSIGALPGEIDDKFSPYSMPLVDKLNEIVADKSSITHLMENEYVKAIPVNFVRGLTFNNSVVIVDEAQNLTKGELVTILTRFGRHTKYIICGDMKQADIRDSGFKEVYDKFNTEHSQKNEIHCVEFDAYDIVRSPILKHITSVLGV